MRYKHLSIVIKCVVLTLIFSSCGAASTRPESSFRDTDLVGTWTAAYPGGGIDRLIIAADGTFRQVYQDGAQKNYIFESPRSSWWTERLSTGLLRLHLKGARYYLDGTRVAERNGRGWCSSTEVDCRRDREPYPFYDPFAHATVYMMDELVLEIRQTSRGDLILHHLWSSSDRGFALIGGESEIYRRVVESEQ